MHDLQSNRLELPFLIVHGAVVWKVLLFTLVIASLAALAFVRARIARRRARVAIKERLRAEPSSSSDNVTLSGELCEGFAITLTQGERQTSSRSDALSLLVEGERIALEGDVRIEHGSREQSTWLRIPRDLPSDLEGWPTRLRPTITRAIEKGDRVIVTASERTKPGDNPGYRDQAVQRALEGRDGPILISAREAVGKSRSLGFAWVVPILLFTGMWSLALWKVGATALKHVGDDVNNISHLEGLRPASIAAAMPGSRDKLFEELDRHLWDLRSQESLDLKLALADYHGQCPYLTLFRNARFEEALAAARRCGSLSSIATALAYLGRYTEAAPLVSARGNNWYLATTIAIATSDWQRAALGADRLAEDYKQRDRRQYYTDADATRFSAGARCLGALFRFYAGEKQTFADITDREGNAQCSMLETLTLPDAEQVRLFADMRFDDDDIHARIQARALWRAAGGASRTLDHIDNELLYDIDHEPWFGALAAQVYRGNDPEVLRVLDVEHAVGAVIRGDFAQARDELQRAIGHGLSPFHAQFLEMQIALHEGTTAMPAHGWSELDTLADIIRPRAGAEPEAIQAYPEQCIAEANAAIRSAQLGDGGALAAVLTRCSVFYGSSERALLGVLPLVKANRSALSRALRLHRDSLTTYSLDWIPFHLINDLVGYRELARFSGDAEEARVLQDIIDRNSAVLADRRKLTAFLFWTR